MTDPTTCAVLRHRRRRRRKFCESCGTALRRRPLRPPTADGGRRGRDQPDEDLGSGPISRADPTQPPTDRRRRGAAVRASAAAARSVPTATATVRRQGAQRARPLPRAARRLGRPACATGASGTTATRTPWRCSPAATPGERAVLVVLDGVSNTEDSAGRLAGRRPRRPRVLRAPFPPGWAPPQPARRGHPVLTDAVGRGQRGGRAATPRRADQPAVVPPSSRAVLRGRPVSYANVGDSPGYWLPDGGPGVQLTRRRLRRAGADRRGHGPRGGRDRSPRRTPSPAGSGSDAPDIRRGSAQLDRRPARLGARLLRRAVELRLRAGARSPSRCARPAPPTRPPSPWRWSSSPTASGGQDNITAVPWPASSRPCRMPHPHPIVAGGVTWLSSAATVYQNEFLPDGGTDVNAIVTVTCTGPARPARPAPARRARSSSSTPPARWVRATMAAAKQAAQAALSEIVDGTWFAVIAGSDRAMLAYPQVQSGPGHGADGRHHPRGRPSAPSAGSSAAAGRRSAPGSTSPASCSPRCPRSPSGTRSCSPTARTARRPTSSTPRSRGPPATSSATAAAPAPTGRSRRSAGSPRRCSAPSTSSRSPRRCSGSSRR